MTATKNRMENLNGQGKLHSIDTSMRMVYTMLTPALAEELLSHLHPNQRSSKEYRIKAMATDAESGRWRETHHALAVDEDGFTVDGQNRCHVCIKSGKNLPVWICYGVPRASLVVMDSGTARNAGDAAKIIDMKIPKAAYISVARQMINGLKIIRKPWSTQQSLDAVATYRESLDFAFTMTHKPVHGVTTASVRAVLARAWYSADHERVTKFAMALTSGFIDNQKKDAAAIMLRNWMLDEVIEWKKRGKQKSPRELIYGFTEYALQAFLQGQRIAQLLTVETEQFPIPPLRSYEDNQ